MKDKNYYKHEDIITRHIKFLKRILVVIYFIQCIVLFLSIIILHELVVI